MPYQAYMLRLWSSEVEGRWVWRASLESVRSSERYIFSDLDAMVDFLQQQMTGQAQNPAGPTQPNQERGAP